MVKKKEEVDLGPLEFEEWKLGQEVWCKDFALGELATGKITRIHLGDSEPCFTFLNKFSGAFSLGLFSSIITEPPASMKKKLANHRAKEQRKDDRRQKTKEAKAKARRPNG